MDHALHLVDLVDQNGSITGSKPRKELDKRSDLYHSVFVLLITPNKKVVLSKIPERHDLPNLYVNQVSATVATVRRNGESTAMAATRALAKEVMLEDQQLQHLGDSFEPFPRERGTYLTAYYTVTDPPVRFSKMDIAELMVLTADELTAKIKHNSEQVSPTLQRLWLTYHKQLPV